MSSNPTIAVTIEIGGVDMLEFLSGISNAITSVFQLLFNLIEGIVQLVALALDFVVYLTLILGYLPPPLVAFAGLGISLSVILLLVGRN